MGLESVLGGEEWVGRTEDSDNEGSRDDAVEVERAEDFSGITEVLYNIVWLWV